MCGFWVDIYIKQLFIPCNTYPGFTLIRENPLINVNPGIKTEKTTEITP